MKLSANWIWSDDSDGRAFNICSIFRRDFRLETLPTQAMLRIAADTVYRLRVNGQWLADGPCRAYPDHYRYDRIDLDGVLRIGVNRIEVEVWYHGSGTFQHVPQRAGLLAQLDCDDLRIITDGDWSSAPVGQWVSNTVKSSCQQAPVELYDATRPDAPWRPAVVIAGAEDGPWKDLQERDCPPLSRREFSLRRVIGCARVAPQLVTVAVGGQQLVFPGETSVESCTTFGMFLVLKVNSPVTQMVRVASRGVRLAVNGKMAINGEVEFRAGSNLLVAAPEDMSGHITTYELGFPADAELVIGNPYDDSPYPAAVVLPECCKIERSTPAPWANAAYQERTRCFMRHCERAFAARNAAEFCTAYPEGRVLTPAELGEDAAALSFDFRRPEPAQPGDVENPDHLIYCDDRCTVINPVPGRDVELCCDLGEENVGYWNFALFAPAGTIVDIAAVEYVTPDGRVQHTPGYRNSLRYVCREGYNRYTSLRRRGGRYLFLTVRNFHEPVRIQFLRLVESTYPVVPYGEFVSSDDLFNRVYEISARTLKLCMEDTFTDCPLYEQTLWVGDARSESLFAMSTYGAYDLVRRCIRLAGQSLEHLPLVGDQVPSGWNSIIPVWSFMWVLSVWDYYEESGDLEFVREVWPMVRLNLDNAAGMIDQKSGLFAAGEWNLFDWSKTSTEQPILLHNSFFLAGALESAARTAEVLGEEADGERFRRFRERLIAALDRTWDSRRLAWPDSIGPDGTASEESSVHTSMLAVLFDAAPAERFASARANTVSPRSELIPVASPFASFYYYQTLEKLHLPGQILDRIRRDYLPMLELGSTTVWETYPAALDVGDDFPTRSHCHAWSAAPLYFLPRLVLGIHNAAPGGKRFVISPRPGSLEWARGARPLFSGGRVVVEWRRRGDELHISATAPEGVELKFEENDELKDFEIIFNGTRL